MTASTMKQWEEPKPAAIVTPEQGARMFFAAALIVFGLVVGGVLVYQIKQFLFGPHTPVLIDRMSVASADELAILIKNGEQSSRIQIPPKTLTVIGGFISLIALAIVSKIACVTINAGAKLLMTNQEDRPGAHR